MKKLIALALALVLAVTCLSGVVFAIDPIAEVTNDGKTSKVYSIDDLTAAVSETGNTKVKVLSRVERIVTDASGQIVFPYTCEVDLNGQTWTNVKSKSGNVLKFNAAGSQNTHAVVKNGTVIGASVGVSIMEGSIEIRDCVIISPKSIGVSMYSTETKYNDKNIIDNCYIMAGGANGGFSFQGTEPMNGVKIKIQNSTVAQVNGAGYTLNNKAAGKAIIELGENVDLYAIEEAFLKEENITLEGKELKPVEGTFTVAATGDGVEYKFDGLMKWTTYVEPAPVAPSTPAVPTVPSTGTPDVSVPTTGVSVMALGVMAMVSLAGAVITKKH